VGIKTKKKKKFRKWQKNSGAIFEKEGVIMGWWEILKSSREEAYAEFVKEFGPEVELDSLRVTPYEDEKQVQIDSSDSEWVINYATTGQYVEQFYFASMSKYGQYGDFVEGMFQQEYPERYQELLDMAKGALTPEQRMINTLGDKDVIYAPADLPDFHSMSFSDRAKWLREHDFCYLANGNFVRQKVRNYLIGSLISYYEQLDSQEVTALLNSNSYNFREFTNIGQLFYEYSEHMHDWMYNDTRKIAAKLRSTTGQVEVLQDILGGRLIRNSYHREHFGRDGGTTLAIKRRRPGEE